MVLVYICFTVTGNSENYTPTPPPNEPTATPEPVAIAVPTPIPTPAPEPAPISISGSGPQLSKIHLEPGLSIFTINHPGNRKCEIWFSNKMNKIDLLASTSNGYFGSIAEAVTVEDDYYLEISANDAYTVRVEQPRPVIASYVPISLTGMGQQVTGFFSLNSGPTMFQMKHDGWSNFDVRLLKSDGSKIEPVIGMNGVFEGTRTINVTQGGIYLLNVMADGNWKIDIVQ